MYKNEKFIYKRWNEFSNQSFLKIQAFLMEIIYRHKIIFFKDCSFHHDGIIIKLINRIYKEIYLIYISIIKIKLLSENCLI